MGRIKTTNPYLNIAHSCHNIVLFKLFIYPFFDSTTLLIVCAFVFFFLQKIIFTGAIQLEMLMIIRLNSPISLFL